MGPRQRQMQIKLQNEFKPSVIELVNESSQHNVPPGSESHFRLFMVSESFRGKNRVQRQQAVYSLVATELQQGLHALTMRLLTPEEQSATDSEFESPACLGGMNKKK